MTKEKFEREYNIPVDQLTWKCHPAGFHKTACIGPFCVYHNLETDGYCIVKDGSVYGWRVDLSNYLPV